MMALDKATIKDMVSDKKYDISSARSQMKSAYGKHYQTLETTCYNIITKDTKIDKKQAQVLVLHILNMALSKEKSPLKASLKAIGIAGAAAKTLKGTKDPATVGGIINGIGIISGSVAGASAITLYLIKLNNQVLMDNGLDRVVSVDKNLDKIEAGLNAFKTQVTDFGGEVEKFVKYGLSTTGNELKSLTDTAQKYYVSLIKSIANKIGSDENKAGLKGIWDTAKEFWSKQYEDNIATGTKAGIKGTLDTAGEFWTDVINDPGNQAGVKGVLDTAATFWKDLGDSAADVVRSYM